MSFGRRLHKLYEENGPWALHISASLAINRIKLTFLRILLGESTIYFQAPPRILGRRGIVFGARFTCGRGAWIEAIIGDDQPMGTRLHIGTDVSVSDYFHVAAARSVTIGDNVLIGSGVLITDHGHGSYGARGSDPGIPPNQRPLHVKGPVHIGRNVWLGDGVRVLSGVCIGENAVIGANTVVRENVPKNCVYGNPTPARPLRAYDSAAARWNGIKTQP